VVQLPGYLSAAEAPWPSPKPVGGLCHCRAFAGHFVTQLSGCGTLELEDVQLLHATRRFHRALRFQRFMIRTLIADLRCVERRRVSLRRTWQLRRSMRSRARCDPRRGFSQTLHDHSRSRRTSAAGEKRRGVAVAVRPSEGSHGNSTVARRDARPSDVASRATGLPTCPAGIPAPSRVRKPSARTEVSGCAERGLTTGRKAGDWCASARCW
jgi:hypothetical protein